MSSGDGSEVSGWMALGGASADADTVKSAGDINITLSKDIEVASTVEDSSLPTMTTDTGNEYLFDFTDGRCAGKTITIDGQGKTINIDNAGLFFLNLKDCRVILKNITIDGGWLGLGEEGKDQGGVQRLGSFIYVLQPSIGKSSELEIDEGTTIQNCKDTENAGGAIYSYGGAVTINGGNITDCTSSAHGDAIAIYNYGILKLPRKEFEFLTITLPGGIGNDDHNTDSASTMEYVGIYNYEQGIIAENTNRKIVFVDESNSSKQLNTFASKYDYVFVNIFGGVSYLNKAGDETFVAVEDGKFQLTQDMVDSAVNGVITMKVTYNKPYTVQYICDGKVVGTKSGCSSELESLDGVIGTDFANITLDGGQKLDAAVGDATLQEKGYTFSKFTYGDGQTYTNSTTWGNLKASAVDNVITIILNYTDCGTVKYVASGHMILDKKSKPTNYSGVNLPISGLQKVSEPKKIIFDFCGQTIHHNDSDVPFIQGVPGKSITICNLHMDGSGCK